MGNSKLNSYRSTNKQNLPLQKLDEKSSEKGKLSIYSKQCKNGNRNFFIVFRTQSTPTSKVIKWSRGQFQILDMSDTQLAKTQKIQEIGEVSEKEVTDAICWSSTGAFASQKKSSSSEWCKSVCWKLGKKVTLA